MKALELVVYPRRGRETYVIPPPRHSLGAVAVDRLSQQKRLTEGELAADYYRTAWLHENSIAENDGYDGTAETRAFRRQTLVIYRFATLPHYDEPLP